METINVTGRRRGEQARQIFREKARQGLHVLLDDRGSLHNNLPERRMSCADVLIIVRKENQTQSTTTTKTP